jgi:3-methylcrotonyl-CoA carboxylase alpha subunit
MDVSRPVGAVAVPPPIVTIVGNGVFRVGDGPARTAWGTTAGTARWVFIDGNVYVIERGREGERPRTRSHGGSLAAPMPATVRKINVAPGDPVKPGEVLIVLEAMKMELPVRAPAAGVVKALLCSEGELVQPGVPLVTLED